MKTIEQIISDYKSDCLDNRDINRLAQFLTAEQLVQMGFILKDPTAPKIEPIPFTRETVLEQLEKDVAFGFEKALNKRGISASLMHDVVRMWNWVLEEGLEDYCEYAQYGLPTLRATAVKYGFHNPIGEDTGSEEKYESE